MTLKVVALPIVDCGNSRTCLTESSKLYISPQFIFWASGKWKGTDPPSMMAKVSREHRLGGIDDKNTLDCYMDLVKTMHCIIRKFQMHLICFFCFPELLLKTCGRAEGFLDAMGRPFGWHQFVLLSTRNSKQQQPSEKSLWYYDMMSHNCLQEVFCNFVILIRFAVWAIFFYLDAYCKLLLHNVYIYISYIYICTFLNVMFSFLPCSIVDLNAIQGIHHSIYRCDA